MSSHTDMTSYFLSDIKPFQPIFLKYSRLFHPRILVYPRVLYGRAVQVQVYRNRSNAWVICKQLEIFL